MSATRADGALLAGVCAGIAGKLGWNVWALRALFVVFLLVKTLWAIAAYAVLALALHLLGDGWPGKEPQREGRGGGLESPELAGRNQRIADLERRFHELEGRGNSGSE
jgi:phage shock protein PspC (stress-responsive transcriptional regulator)